MRNASMVLLAVLPLFSGCNSAASASGDQVVAVVDGKELTTPVLEGALNGLPPQLDRKSPATQRATVDQLINEMLLADAAREQGLDKKPQTTRDLARAERAVLADAYLRRTNVAGPPSDQQVVGYFSEHPYLFAERRRYHVHKLAVTGPKAQVDPYVAVFTGAGGSLDALSDALAKNGVQSIVEDLILDADAFGSDLAGKLARLNAGDTFNYRQGDVHIFARIDDVAPSPVPLSLARPVISAMLAEQNRAAGVKSTIDRLRSAARIDYGSVGKSILAKPTT